MVRSPEVAQALERVEGRVVGCLRPGEVTIWLLAGGPITVPIERCAPDCRMPNSPVWVHLSGEPLDAVRVWRRVDE